MALANKSIVIGSTAVVIGTGLMIVLRTADAPNKNKRDYEYFFNRAQDKFEVANYEGAILDYNKALELSPTISSPIDSTTPAASIPGTNGNVGAG